MVRPHGATPRRFLDKQNHLCRLAIGENSGIVGMGCGVIMQTLSQPNDALEEVAVHGSTVGASQCGRGTVQAQGTRCDAQGAGLVGLMWRLVLLPGAPDTKLAAANARGRGVEAVCRACSLHGDRRLWHCCSGHRCWCHVDGGGGTSTRLLRCLPCRVPRSHSLGRGPRFDSASPAAPTFTIQITQSTCPRLSGCGCPSIDNDGNHNVAPATHGVVDQVLLLRAVATGVTCRVARSGVWWLLLMVV